MPTLASPSWEAERPRMPGLAFLFTTSTTVKWMAVDIKGNVSGVRSAEFVIDATAPVPTAMVSPAGVNGWNVNPTITLAADDGAGSGVDFIQYRLDGGPWMTYSSPFVVSGDGSRVLEYQAFDLRQNVEAAQTLVLQLDATLPVIEVTTPSAGGVYLLGAIVPAAYGCTDTTSGVLLCAGSVAAGAPIDTATAGPRMFVINTQDVAGNTRQQTVAYEVVPPWPFSGFSGSISDTAENVARAGSVVAVRFDLGADRGLDIFAPGYPASAPRACAGGSEGALVATETPGGNALRFNNGTYSYNWKTDQSWDGTCRVLVLKFADQSEVRALFRFH